MTRLARIVRLPTSAADEIRLYWLTSDELIADDHFDPGDGDMPTIALAMPDSVVCRWHDYPALAPRQAEAAARIDAAAASVDSNALHIVARASDDGRVTSAAIDRASLASALERLLAVGIDPDHVVPLGLLAPDSDNGALRIAFDGASALRRGAIISPDDPILAERLLGIDPISQLPDSAFAAALEQSVEDPPVELRSGPFAKKNTRQGWEKDKLRLAVYATAAGLVFSLLLALVSWLKVDRAIAREDARTVALAQKVAPDVTSASEAPAKVEQRLAARGAGNRAFTVLSSALWQALQKVEGVNLRDMRYGRDGILAVTLTSAAVDPVNQVLIDLQQQGYKITATPRQEANGMAAAAVTVRAP
jgi:general secretion pathway protein L